MSMSTKSCAAKAVPRSLAFFPLAMALSKLRSVSACFSKFFGSMGIPAVAGVVVDRESCHGKGPAHWPDLKATRRKLAKAA